MNTYYFDGKIECMYIVFPNDPKKGWRINEEWSTSYLRSTYPNNRFL